MEESFVLNGNKLIAEFIGFKETNTEDVWSTVEYLEENFTSNLPCSVPVTDYLYFDKSWDALMPVVEKIESINMDTIIPIFSFHISDCHCKITSHPQWDYHMEIYKDEIETDAKTKLKATYKAVIKFIKWYNENKK